MGVLSHVRLRFWDSERYTEAQALEFRKLRLLYVRHLAPLFGQELPVVLRLRTEGNEYYPAYTGVAPATGIARGGEEQPAQLLRPFVNALMASLRVYEQRRQERHFGKGHVNDPARLLLQYLRNTFSEWMAFAPGNEVTLKRVIALREFLEALRRDNVFRAETEGHGSMRVLLHNLIHPLNLVQEHLTYEISLQSAREHFSTLKSKVNEALDQSSQYLFYAVAEKSRTDLAFSLLSAPADVVDAKLHKALQTREGVLLKNLMQYPVVMRALFPQGNVRANGFGKPVCLVGEGEATPFIDGVGQANPLWLDFLQQSPALEAQIDPSLKKLPAGVCPLLRSESKRPDSESLAAPTTLANFVRLHGFVVILAQYQDYLQQCWQLAGFGGDQLIYDKLAQAIATLFTEFSAFNKALQELIKAFQEQLDHHDTESLHLSSYRSWRANYEHATSCQQALLRMLADCELTLSKIITHAQDASARCRRFEAALETCKRLRGAKDFLTKVRLQIGLAPQANYPGLDSSEAKAEEHPSLPVEHHVREIDQVLLAFIPNTPRQLSLLSRVCAETSQTMPRSLFRGSYRRYCYLQDAKRLLKIGDDFRRLQYYPERALSSTAKFLVDSLRSQMRSELARIAHLSQGLHWPFHRTSQQFFLGWQQVFREGLAQLDRIDVAREARRAEEAKRELEMKAALLLVPPAPSPEMKLENTIPVSSSEVKSEDTSPVQTLEVNLESAAVISARPSIAVSSSPVVTESKQEDSKNTLRQDGNALKRADSALERAQQLLAATLAEKSQLVLSSDFKLPPPSYTRVRSTPSSDAEVKVNLISTYS